jgi:hypothetical protein
MSADETKVGHGFVAGPVAGYCDAADPKAPTSIYACGLPRSAHPGEERLKRDDRQDEDESAETRRACAEERKVDAVEASEQILDDKLAQLSPTPAGITKQASEIGGLPESLWLEFLVSPALPQQRESIRTLISAAFRLGSEGGGEGAEALKILRGLHTPGCEHWRIVVANCCEGNDRWLAQFAAPSGEKGWRQGYRAGLEAAAKLADQHAITGEDIGDAIRALPIPE